METREFKNGYEAGLEGPFDGYVFANSKDYREGYRKGESERLEAERTLLAED